MKKLNKNEIIEMVAENKHLSKKEAKDTIDELFKIISEHLENGEEVNITNFGVFTPKAKKSRVGTHPKTHERIEIKEKNTVIFRLSKNFKETL